jgi:pimeloyl-ACP methyl ester carboxylesterase
MNVTYDALRTSDGRVLELAWAGPPARSALLVVLGTPSAGLLFGPHVAVAAARGLRTVTMTRPGYAGSTRLPGRSVADCAADVAAVTSALGLERLHVVGWSGGGPHALACAALLPGLVASAATIGGVAPWGADGLDWLAGMGPENVEEFGAALAGAEALRPYLETQQAVLAAVTGDQLAEAFGGLIGDVDRACLSGPLAGWLAATVRRAMSTGIDGWLDDDLAFTRPWGFDLSAVDVPVTVWQGADDRMVPSAHGAWLARNVPGAREELLEGEGHLSLAVTRFADVVDLLLA